MTLKLTLKPGEAVYVGTTRVTVVSMSTCTVMIDGSAPIMRAHEMLEREAATQPLPRFRYILQEIYLRNDLAALIGEYFEAASALLAIQPDAIDIVNRTNHMLGAGALYEAVRIGKELALADRSEQTAWSPAERRVAKLGA